MLFVAAEYPFRKVIGVEFSNALHDDAVANLKRYRFPKRRCADIEPVHADAREFEFPNDNLVIYLFNPFGEEVMERMLAESGKVAGEESSPCDCGDVIGRITPMLLNGCRLCGCTGRRGGIISMRRESVLDGLEKRRGSVQQQTPLGDDNQKRARQRL